MDIEVLGLQKKFGEKQLFYGLTIKIFSEKTNVILGSSGCGKSTILKIISGIESWDEGNILFDGKPQTMNSLRSHVSNIGYMTQKSGLFPHLSVDENITLVSRLRGKKTNEIEEKKYHLLNLFSLERSLLKKYPSQISGGEGQRVSLIRAFMMSPKILFLDEPLSALDPITRRKLQTELKEIFKTLDITVVLVTHDINEAYMLGDYLYLLDRGSLVQEGVFSQFINKPNNEFVTKFFTSQMYNLGENS